MRKQRFCSRNEQCQNDSIYLCGCKRQILTNASTTCKNTLTSNTPQGHKSGSFSGRRKYAYPITELPPRGQEAKSKKRTHLPLQRKSPSSHCPTEPVCPRGKCKRQRLLKIQRLKAPSSCWPKPWTLPAQSSNRVVDYESARYRQQKVTSLLSTVEQGSWQSRDRGRRQVRP